MQTIDIDKFQDNRGLLIYANKFKLSSFQRCYHITHDQTSVIRAWQGHRKEVKAFWVTKGSFLLKWTLIGDFDKPDENLEVKSCILGFEEPKILILPGGFANGFQALEEKSSLMVFSNLSIEKSKEDDYRWDKNYFKNSQWQ